jgi:hypothetical protein
MKPVAYLRTSKSGATGVILAEFYDGADDGWTYEPLYKAVYSPPPVVSIKPLDWKMAFDNVGNPSRVHVADDPIFGVRRWAERPEYMVKIDARRSELLMQAVQINPVQP